MAEFFTSLFANVVSACLWDAGQNRVKKQVNYLCCISSNVRRLEDEIQELNTKKLSLEQKIEEAKNNVEDIIPEAESWLREAYKVLTKGNEIVDDAASQVQKGCLSKWCPVLHYTLSKEATKIIAKSIDLKNSKFDSGISKPRNVADITPPPTSQICFESRDLIENEIMNALKDENVYLIGLYGMGGVGKTTMARSIAGRAREDPSKRVVMAVVSQTPNVYQIQQEIAEGVGLHLKEKSKGSRATLLHEKLKNEKCLLIILDDVWERLDLEEIGIPSQATNPMCKLILTSRYRHVLGLTEYAARVLQLDVLTPEESWDLFTKMNAGNAEISPNLHQIAKEVVKECKGLPLALAAVGRALKGRGKLFWENALRELGKSRPMNIPNVPDNVYTPLRWSFNHLQSDESRYLFLLCCLFPEDSDISIETLVGYGIGLEIFKDMEDLGQARIKVGAIVEDLISRSLLINTSDDERDDIIHRVKMHDVVRDVGIFIVSEKKKNIENEWMPVFGISHGGKEWPATFPNNCTCISLEIFSRGTMIDSNYINCPSLELLRIRCETKLAESFFNEISELKVLEAFRIKSLPSSNLQWLKNLRALCLSDCNLENSLLTGLGKLSNLEILRFEYFDDVGVLPKEMGGLKKLRKLDIRHCWNLSTIAFGVVSGLVRLEELVIMKSFKGWEALENNDNKMFNNASLIELDSLRHLTTLHIEISSPSAIPEKKPSWVERLKNYFIYASSLSTNSLCRELQSNVDREFQKVMVFHGQEGTRLGNWFYEMIRDADYLDLKGSQCIFFVNILDQSGYQNLKHFSLSHFGSVQYLSCSLSQGVVFTKLEIINISDCESLLHLFPFSTIERLPELRELQVSHCPAMKEIFRKEEGGSEITALRRRTGFPKLKRIALESLTSLHDFCKGVNEIDVPTISSVFIANLPRIEAEGHQQYLFDQVVEEDNSLKLPMMLSSNFNIGTGLQKLEIRSIHNFICLFSHKSALSSSFPNLSTMKIEDCSKLEVVIGRSTEENIVPEIRSKLTRLFPRLQSLVLSKLPNILGFCHIMGEVELPSLKYLRIKDCPMMHTFVEAISGTSNCFFSEKVLCPKLSDLRIGKLNIMRIFDPRSIENFCDLNYVEVNFCDRLKSLFSLSYFRNLQKLKYLHMGDCKELEQVIAKEDEEEQTETTLLSFPILRSIKLVRLPEMHAFCPTRRHLEMASLDEVRIEECPMLQRFTSGLLHLPQFCRIRGLSDHDFAAKIFFNKENSPHKTDLDNNCFAISARDLSFETTKATNADKAVEWLLLPPPNSRDSFVLVGQVHPLYKKMKITGKIETIKLSAGDEYEIIFMMMLDDSITMWSLLNLELTLLHGEITQTRTESLKKKPINKWIEILVGEFKREAQAHHQIGDHLEFSLSLLNLGVTKYGPIIGGARIEKKLTRIE